MLSLLGQDFRPTLESILDYDHNHSVHPLSWGWRPSPVVRRAPTEDEVKAMKLRKARQRVAALQRAEQETVEEYERLERLREELAERQEFLTARKGEIEEERIQLQKEADAVEAELHAKQQAELEQARERRRKELEEQRQLVEERRRRQAKADAATSVDVMLKKTDKKQEEKSLQEHKTSKPSTGELGRMKVDRADQHLTLTFAVPGVSQDGLRLHVKDDVFGKALQVSGQHKTETEDGVVQSSEFFRSIPLPSHTTRADVSAELDEASGSLRVTVQLPSAESKVAQGAQGAQAESKQDPSALPAPAVPHKSAGVKEHQDHKAESKAASGADKHTSADEHKVDVSIKNKAEQKSR